MGCGCPPLSLPPNSCPRRCPRPTCPPQPSPTDVISSGDLGRRAAGEGSARQPPLCLWLRGETEALAGGGSGGSAWGSGRLTPGAPRWTPEAGGARAGAGSAQLGIRWEGRRRRPEPRSPLLSRQAPLMASPSYRTGSCLQRWRPPSPGAAPPARLRARPAARAQRLRRCWRRRLRFPAVVGSVRPGGQTPASLAAFHPEAGPRQPLAWVPAHRSPRLPRLGGPRVPCGLWPRRWPKGTVGGAAVTSGCLWQACPLRLQCGGSALLPPVPLPRRQGCPLGGRGGAGEEGAQVGGRVLGQGPPERGGGRS